MTATSTAPAPTDAELRLMAARLRRTTIEMCRGQGQGYAGQGLELADVMAVIFHDVLRRDDGGGLIDRFVLSTGHSAIALYAALWSIGRYDLDTLRTYGADGTHVEESPLDDLRGFEVTGGSLGQGPSQAVGIALGERMAGRDTRVVCELSDGELQEGSVWEAFMLASARGLANLTFVVDDNGEQADGPTAEVLDPGDVAAKLTAFGLATSTVDGHDVGALRGAFADAAAAHGPAAVVARTVPGHGVGALDRFRRVHYVRADDDLWQEAADELDTVIAGLEGGDDDR